MKIYIRSLLITFLTFLASASFIQAQTTVKEASVKVAGDVKTALTLTAEDMDKLEKTTVQASDRNNKSHMYSGVLLSTILQKAGVTLGAELRGENLMKYLVLEASDGYQVLFSLPEVDPAFSAKKIILASRIDGALLGAEQGPFKIIVEGEKKKARFIRQVTSIIVKYAK